MVYPTITLRGTLAYFFYIHGIEYFFLLPAFLFCNVLIGYMGIRTFVLIGGISHIILLDLISPGGVDNRLSGELLF